MGDAAVGSLARVDEAMTIISLAPVSEYLAPKGTR